jgi:hypothetical protein
LIHSQSKFNSLLLDGAEQSETVLDFVLRSVGFHSGGDHGNKIALSSHLVGVAHHGDINVCKNVTINARAQEKIGKCSQINPFVILKENYFLDPLAFFKCRFVKKAYSLYSSLFLSKSTFETCKN